MRISVIRFKGAAPAVPIEFDFDARGGTIGRDASCALVLSDPERTVSRLQAKVGYDGARFQLVDHGSNPTLIDGRPLGKGASVELRGGERIVIGQYELEAQAPVQAEAVPALAAAPLTDPLGLLGTTSAPSTAHDDPFARYAQPAVAASVVPVDDDPFAVFSAPTPIAPPTVVEPAAGPLGLGSDIQQPSVDALFGLDVRQGDVFAGTALAKYAAAPASGSLDPLALFGAAPAASQAEPVRDDAPLLRQAFTPPSPRQPLAAPVELAADCQAPAVDPPSLPAHTAASGMVFSWEGQPARPAAPLPGSPILPSDVTVVVPAPAAPEPVTAGLAAAPSPASEVRPAPVTNPVAAGADPLLDAFLRGLGVPLDLGALTPELMQQIGAILREATQGTLDLMQTRALTKRELRAEQTMIVSKGNNPLKFSPDLAFALMQLLTARASGFMRAEEAMRDAYDDLRAHQFGFMAGMRAALAGVLQRFTPAEIEQRVAARGLLDNLLPASRKARMWDLFESKYAEISREAADDFHTLFGREFLRAYEEQVERLRDGNDARNQSSSDVDRRPHA